MKTYVTAVMMLLLLAVPAGAQTPEGEPSRQDGPAAVTQSEQLDEAARLTAEVLHLFSQRRYDDAAPPAEKVLDIRLKALGADHRGVAEAEYNLGMIRVGQGRFEDAEGLLRRALAVYEKSPAPPATLHAKVLNGLALVRAKLGHEDEALKFSQSALGAAEKALGPEHEELADYYRQLADIHRLKGDEGKAVDHYLRAIGIWAKAAGREDARVEMAVESLMCTAAGGRKYTNVWGKLGKLLEDADPTYGTVLVGKAISKPQPSYPPEAKAAHVSGSVVVKIWVDETGVVTRQQAVCGPRLLAGASMGAARRARFRPSLVDGKPSKVTGFIVYNFVLQ
jgi:TonB family protein